MPVCRQRFVVKIIWLMCIGIAPVSTSLASHTTISETLESHIPSQLKLSYQERPRNNTSQVKKLFEGDSDNGHHEVYSPVTSPTSFAAMHLRLATMKYKGVATGELVKYFVESSIGWNVYIFYDQLLFPDIAEALRSCYKLVAKVALLNCEVGIKQINSIIQSNTIHRNMSKIIVLCSSSQTKELFQQVHDQYLESPSTHWFVVLQDNTMHDILLQMREGTQVSFAKKEDNSRYGLYNSFIDLDNIVAIRYIGWWSWDTKRGPSNSLKAPLVKPLEEIYSDFGGRELTVAAFHNWPYWILTEYDGSSFENVRGIDFNIVRDISKTLNFTFKVFVNPKGTGTGGVKADGTVTGVMGQVHSHFVHFTINEVTVTANREQAVDFTYPYLLESITLISPAPKKKLKAYAVFTSFTYEVWILTVAVTIVIGPLVWLIFRIKREYSDEDDVSRWNSLSDVSLVMFQSIVLQAAPYPSRGAVSMLLFISWYIFCLLVTCLYSDVMISTLVVPSYEKPIDSLSDLLQAIQQRSFKVALYCDTTLEYLFTRSNQKIYQEIHETFDTSKECVKAHDEGMDKILTGKYVAVNNHMSAEIRANIRGRERYYMARNEFYPHGYGIACPNGSPYRDPFHEIIQPLMWSGLVQKYTNDELRKARVRVTDDEAGPEAFTLLHLQSAFFLYAIGNIVSTVVFLTEQLTGHHQKNQ